MTTEFPLAPLPADPERANKKPGFGILVFCSSGSRSCNDGFVQLGVSSGEAVLVYKDGQFLKTTIIDAQERIEHNDTEMVFYFEISGSGNAVMIAKEQNLKLGGKYTLPSEAILGYIGPQFEKINCNGLTFYAFWGRKEEEAYQNIEIFMASNV